MTQTRADETKTHINKLRIAIQKNDDDIEERKRRLSLCRKFGDRLYNRLVLLEAQLEREEAPLVRPQPERVDCGNWSI